MTLTPKKQSTIFVIAGGLVAAIGTIMIIRYFKGKNIAKNNTPDSGAGTPASKPIVSSAWPLKNGSRGDSVKQLQSLLGVSADGIFGPITQAALLAQTGKTSIASQSEFNTIIAQLQNKPVISNNKARAQQLIDQWNAATFVYQRQLMATSKVIAYGVIEDAAGALLPNNKNITLVANQKLNRNDYKPVGVTTQGFLRIQVMNGDLKGLYKVDPNKMSVV